MTNRTSPIDDRVRRLWRVSRDALRTKTPDVEPSDRLVAEEMQRRFEENPNVWGGSDVGRKVKKPASLLEDTVFRIRKKEEGRRDQRRSAAPSGAMSPDLLVKKREERYALLSAEVFQPLAEVLRGTRRRRLMIPEARDMDFSVEFSTEGLQNHTLFDEGMEHLRRSVAAKGPADSLKLLDELVESFDRLEKSVADWNDRAMTAVRGFDKIALDRLGEVVPIAESHTIPPWIPGKLCAPYVLAELHKCWYNLALRDRRPQYLVERKWPTSAAVRKWLEDGGYRVDEYDWFRMPQVRWNKPWAYIGSHGVAEFREEDAEAKSGRLLEVVSDLVASPEILSGIADLRTRQSEMEDGVSKELSRFAPLVMIIDKVCEEIRVDRYSDP